MKKERHAAQTLVQRFFEGRSFDSDMFGLEQLLTAALDGNHTTLAINVIFFLFQFAAIFLEICLFSGSNDL